MKKLGIGCLVLIGLVLTLIVAIVVFSKVQLGRVQAKADAIKSGMSAGDATKNAGDWFVLWLTRDSDSSLRYRANRTSPGRYLVVDIEGIRSTPYSTESEFLAALTRLTQDGHHWKMTFRYVTVLPRQAEFKVELDEQGRVAKVTEATAED